MTIIGRHKEPYAFKLCPECGGEMGLYDLPGPEIYQDLEWGCHECGISESYMDWCARTGREVKFK